MVFDDVNFNDLDLVLQHGKSIIISEDGLAKYRGMTGQWIGALDILEAGKYYDIKLKSDITQPYIFRNKFIYCL